MPVPRFTRSAVSPNPRASAIQFPDVQPVRFDAQSSLLVSGLLEGGADIAQRPVVVDVPVGKGHVVLFANNPIWRGSTIGSYFLVFNALLNHDSLDAGRTLERGDGVKSRWDRAGRRNRELQLKEQP